MRFLQEHSEFPAMLASEANYLSGHIYKQDGSPAVFILQNKIDLGLDQCRQELLQEVAEGQAKEAKVYGKSARFTGVVDKTYRSSKILKSKNHYINAAHNALDLAFVQHVLPNVKCKLFSFGQNLSYDCCSAPLEVRFPFKINARQQMIYKKDDHFNISAKEIKGHADDSILENGNWIRDKSFRHFSGLLYLSTSVDKVTDENREFSNGDLLFPTISSDGKNPLVVKPKFGTMVFFPCSPMYTHTVLKVSAGTRIACLTWFNVPEYV